MADKNLVLEFATAGGGRTTMTLTGAKQDLDGTTVKAGMQAMVDAGCFATEKGAAYTGVISADYEETIVTALFDDSASA